MLPPAAYIYPISTLYVTVLTIRTFAPEPWRPRTGRRCSASTRADPRWPRQPFKLRLRRPTFDGTTGIIRYADVDGTVVLARAALNTALSAAGAMASVGGGDTGLAQPPDGVVGREREVGPHIPNIVHSTVMRWAAPPPDVDAARAAFEGVAAGWEPTVGGAIDRRGSPCPETALSLQVHHYTPQSPLKPP